MLSFVGETRVLAMSGDGSDVEMDEVTLPGFVHDAQTRLCATTRAGEILQVPLSCVCVCVCACVCARVCVCVCVSV